MTTLDAICDGTRSLLTTLGYVEAVSPFDFDMQPTGNLDACFRVTDAGTNRATAGFRFSETRVDRLVIYVARKFAGEPVTAHRVLTRDMHSITAAVARYGEETLGEFCLDDGRAHEIRAGKGAEYAVLQLTVPVNYEAQL